MIVRFIYSRKDSGLSITLRTPAETFGVKPARGSPAMRAQALHRLKGVLFCCGAACLLAWHALHGIQGWRRKRFRPGCRQFASGSKGLRALTAAPTSLCGEAREKTSHHRRKCANLSVRERLLSFRVPSRRSFLLRTTRFCGSDVRKELHRLNDRLIMGRRMTSPRGGSLAPKTGREEDNIPQAAEKQG